MNKKLKISIITPSYNSGKTIERAIKSVLNQNYHNWEHIIVDGKSSDNTLITLKKYPHLKWKSEKDSGQEEAMEKGFNMSSGDIICYLNADDYFLQGAFSSVIKEFKKGAKFVVGKIKVISPRQGTTYINDPKISFNEMLHHWEPNAYPQNPVGYFYIKEIQKEFPINKENHAIQDLEFLLDVATKYKFSKINKILGCFEDETDTITGKTQSKINYWQPSTFSFIEKYLYSYSPEKKEEYYLERINGYINVQRHQNKMNKIELISKSALPKVSVIIPTYNDVSHVSRSINSVISQNIPNIEIIVINDASTDSTKALLDKKYSNNATIKIIHNKMNVKLGASRNIGLSFATGKYIFFLDSDDWIDSGALHTLLSVAETYQVDIVECGIKKQWDNKTENIYHSYSFGCKGGVEGLQYLSEYKIASIVWNKLYRRDLIEKEHLKFIDKYWHEDVIFTTNAIYHCKNFISISQTFCNYFQRKESIVNTTPTKLHLESYINLFRELINFIHNNNLANSYHGTRVARRMIESHAICNTLPNLYRYIAANPETWVNDFCNICQNKFGTSGLAIFELLKNSLQLPQSKNSSSTSPTYNFTVTELKIVNSIRKLKNITIPEGSKRKKIFDLFKRFKKLF